MLQYNTRAVRKRGTLSGGQVTGESPCRGAGELTSIGFLKAGSRGAAPGGVSGVSPDFLPPFAPEGGVPKNLYLKGGGVPRKFFFYVRRRRRRVESGRQVTAF